VKYAYWFFLCTSPLWVAMFVIGVVSITRTKPPKDIVCPKPETNLLQALNGVATSQLSSVTCHYHYTSGVVRVDSRDYAEGVNDALDTFVLLNLEQQLQHTNRTYGEMAEIVCERMKVKRTELGKSK